MSDGRPFKAFLNLECSPNVPFDKYTYCWCSTPKLVGLVADFYVEAMHNGEWVKLADLNDKQAEEYVLNALSYYKKHLDRKAQKEIDRKQ